MATKNVNLGTIPVSRGEFNSTTIYYKDNIVQYKRGSYQVISESPIIGVPPTNDKNIVNPSWTLFAGTLDAQDVVNQVKDQEIKSIQAVADREAEILAKSDAAEVSFDNTGTSISGTNVQDALEKTDDKLSKLESEVIYDVTTNNDGAIFPSLSALLSSENLSTLIPTSVRYGGMSIRFIQSSDNKYVQYRLIADEFTTDTTQWAVADEGAYINNPEFIYIKTDVEGKILWAISADGNIYYGAGVPQQVIDYIEKKIAGFSPDKYEDIVAFLNGLEQGDKTLQTLLNEKIDKEEGKSLISAGYASSQSAIDNSEYLQVTTDNSDKILEGITTKGIKQINTPIDTPSAIVEHAENPEWVSVTINRENKILEGISSEGVKHINLPINTPKVETKELILSENGIEKFKESLDIQHSEYDVISVNLDKECSLYAMAYDYPFFCYPGHENSGVGARYKKRLVFGWISDIHGGAEEYERFIKYNNNYKDVIDFMLVTGDLSSLAPRDGGWHDTQDAFAPIAEMPILICLGNHDVVGNIGNEVIFDSLKEMDDELFMPWANQIEWTNKGSGSYYYKDFVNNDSGYKYRVIILNDYERPRLVSDGSWKTIDYDNALPTYSPDYSYSIGDKINLNNHSYEAVKSVSGIAPSRTYFDYIDGRYISETQALWLCDALSSMPDGYKAIICSHMMIGYTTPISGNFTYSNGNTIGFQMSQNGYVVQDIINAFISKTSISKTYEMTKRMDSGRIDGEVIEGFGYTLNYDFSNISENIDIKCCLTGHTHIDMVTKLTNIPEKDIYDIMITQGVAQFQTGDLGNFGKKGKDAFNIISVNKNIGLKMIRIGNDVTQDFTKRDNIIINI